MEILLQIRAGIGLRFFFMLGISLPSLFLAACDIGSPALPTLTPESAVTPSVTFMRNDATQTPSQPQSTPDTTPPAASPTTDTAADSRIVYLAPDGFTVMSVRQDGSMPRTEAFIKKESEARVVNLSVDPTDTYMVYGLIGYYATYVRSGDLVTMLSHRIGMPKWSPNGTQFVAQTIGIDSLGDLYLYDTAHKTEEILRVQGSPDWFPDGKRLLYPYGSNILSYDLETKVSTPLTTLPYDDKNKWNIDEAHVLPSGDKIIFFGGEALKDGQPVFGPHGEEQIWWWIPAGGGTPQHWGEIVGKAGGVGIYAASPRRDRIAVSHTHFAGATCPAYEDAAVVGFDVELDGLSSTLPITATSAPYTVSDPAGAWVTQINGITWSPDGSEFAYGVERHACSPDGPADDPLSNTIYVWDGDPDKEPRLSIEGSYPNWVREGSP
jgi:Tol biopolymer transport system component